MVSYSDEVCCEAPTHSADTSADVGSNCSSSSFMLVASDGEHFSVPMCFVDRSKVLQRLWDFQAECPPVLPLQANELLAHIQFNASHGSSDHEMQEGREHKLARMIQVLHVRFHAWFLVA